MASLLERQRSAQMPPSRHVGCDGQFLGKGKWAPFLRARSRAEVGPNSAADKQPDSSGADSAVVLGCVTGVGIGSEVPEGECTSCGPDQPVSDDVIFVVPLFAERDFEHRNLIESQRPDTAASLLLKKEQRIRFVLEVVRHQWSNEVWGVDADAHAWHERDTILIGGGLRGLLRRLGASSRRDHHETDANESQDSQEITPIESEDEVLGTWKVARNK